MTARIFALCLLLLLATAEAQQTIHPLWLKGVAIFQRNRNWNPGTIVSRMETLTRKGKVQSILEIRVRVYAGNGGLQQETVLVTKDGKDITAAYKKSEAKARSENRTVGVSLDENPFNPELQQEIRVTPTAERQLLFGRNCQRFDYRQPLRARQGDKKIEQQAVGRAWLEEETGLPVKVEFTFDPLPRMTKSVWTTMLYRLNAEGRWELAEMQVEGTGRLLFIKKRFRMRITFADYWEQSRPPQEKSKGGSALDTGARTPLR